MSLSHHLPREAGFISGDQGWNDESVGLHLLGFLRALVDERVSPSCIDSHEGLDAELVAYFALVQAEENTMAVVGSVIRHETKRPEPVHAPVFTATFIGQAWLRDHAIEVDDSRVSFEVTMADIKAAAQHRPDFNPDGFEDHQALMTALECEDEIRDDLRYAAAAPSRLRYWPGPFEIDLTPSAEAAENEDAPKPTPFEE